jgi:hypothetical protein
MDQYRWPLLRLFQTWLSATAVTTLDVHHNVDVDSSDYYPSSWGIKARRVE